MKSRFQICRGRSIHIEVKEQAMPYTTERGVTSYSDHDTPPEYATSADEERAAYNDAHDDAFRAVEELYGLVDDLIEPTKNATAAAMGQLRDKIIALAADAKKLTSS